MIEENLSMIIAKLDLIAPAWANRLRMQLSNTILYDNLSTAEVQRVLAVIRGLNTADLFDQSVMHYQNADRFYRFLDVLRNSLILAPIVLTWFGLSSAVAAYASYSGPDLPFLVLWESGFGGKLISELKLSNIAWIDSVIIAGLMVLTFAVNLGGNVIEKDSFKKAQELKNDLQALIFEVEDLLLEKYPVLASTAEKDFNSAVVNLERISSNMQLQHDSVLNYLAAEHERLSSLSSIQMTNAQSLENASNTLYQAISQIVDALRELRINVNEIMNNVLQQFPVLSQLVTSSNINSNYLRILTEQALVSEVETKKLSDVQKGLLNEIGDASSKFVLGVQSFNVGKEKMSDLIENLRSLMQIQLEETKSLQAMLCQLDKTTELLAKAQLQHQTELIELLNDSVDAARSLNDSLETFESTQVISSNQQNSHNGNRSFLEKIKSLLDW